MEREFHDAPGNSYLEEKINPKTLEKIGDDPEKFYMEIINLCGEARIKLVKVNGSDGIKYYIRLTRKG